MKASTVLMLLTLPGLMAVQARGELKLLPDPEPQRVFAGKGRMLNLIWQNPGRDLVTADLQAHVLQTSTSTATAVGASPWKKLQVLPSQTILEHATLDFPEVKAETRFVIQWIDGTNRVLGTTELRVYPTNLLGELKSLAGEDQRVGVFDPENVLKPLLKSAAVEFDDMANSGVASFRGRLAIIGPFNSRESSPGDLRTRVEKLARTGACVIWFQPPPAPGAKLQPSFYILPLSSNAVVIAQSTLVSNLVNDPQSVLNLLHFCQLACQPESLTLPNSNPPTP